MELKKTFSIDTIVDSATDRPFGSRFAGEFIVRRPTLADREKIAILDAARLPVDRQAVPLQVENLSFVFSNMAVIAEKTPDWFDPSKLYGDDDERTEDVRAVYAVWKEVRTFLNSFRSGGNPPVGG